MRFGMSSCAVFFSAGLIACGDDETSAPQQGSAPPASLASRPTTEAVNRRLASVAIVRHSVGRDRRTLRLEVIASPQYPIVEATVTTERTRVSISVIQRLPKKPIRAGGEYRCVRVQLPSALGERELFSGRSSRRIRAIGAGSSPLPMPCRRVRVRSVAQR